MKKYLMMGIAALAVASCVSDPEITVQTQEEKYEAAFANEFGTVAQGVNWGFTNQTPTVFDANGKVITRGANVNGNEWANYIEVPAALTDQQKAVVRDWFQSHPKADGTSVNWSDFWVQQVYKGGTEPTENCPEAYTAGNGSTGIVGSAHMDKLTAGPADEHINNFNYGNNTDWDGLTLMQQSSTSTFGYITSESSEQKHKYIIVAGDEIDPIVAGMYFVGFDFESTGAEPNQQIAADGYYSDWIVRIVPGTYKDAQRVFVEDLIASDLTDVKSSDWDFNDVVFDVKFLAQYENNQNYAYAVITLWAAGGTKELTVGGQEVHELLGQGTDVMVNTGATVGKHVDGVAPVIFRVNLGVYDWNKTYNANDIVVKVGSTELISEQSAATQKLSAPTSVKWVDERTNIKEVYGNFVPYVQGQRSTWY